MRILKLPLWIHFAGHLALSPTAIFYLGHLSSYLEHAHGGMLIPAITRAVIEWRNLLWLVPLCFGVIALWLSMRTTIEPPVILLYTSASVCTALCVISIATLVSCFPFTYSPFIK